MFTVSAIGIFRILASCQWILNFGWESIGSSSSSTPSGEHILAVLLSCKSNWSKASSSNASSRTSNSTQTPLRAFWRPVVRPKKILTDDYLKYLTNGTTTNLATKNTIKGMFFPTHSIVPRKSTRDQSNAYSIEKNMPFIHIFPLKCGGIHGYT